ncbi:SDR family NAD(P)-dependent oxidoreductase [Herbiconiux sp. P16]|uniref:SDR family NAD(P)-dependent oxidoreductase n=1 Tax=Herbiconiux wuyangfengii TaxID=3342794 RepID=UPI003CF272CC
MPALRPELPRSDELAVELLTSATAGHAERACADDVEGASYEKLRARGRGAVLWPGTAIVLFALHWVIRSAVQSALRGSGSVVNVGSVAGSMSMAGATMYSASKAAVHQLTKVWVAEYAQSGVRVNSVAPGYTETEGSRANTDETLRDALVSITPAGRGGTPEEIADAVAFLVSDEARYVHGAFLTVDGGSGA